MRDNKRHNLQPSLLLQVFKKYVQLIHDHLFYRHTYTIGKENLPPKGTPMLIACNHQNCMNDPVGLLFALGRHAKFLTRADVFSKKITNKLLRGIGLLPAYRMDFDGIDAVKNNSASWATSEEELLQGQPIVIFPEGMHQDIHWLGEFTFGYTKMAFEAAQAGDFQKEIFIVPAANHYSNYTHMQSDLVIAFGEPVSIQPYYELFKTKPRTAQRQVNKIVHQRISDLMLNITDLDNYEAIDYIRNTYGKQYAAANGFDPKRLDQKMQADKQLVAKLDEYKATHETEANEIYAEAIDLKNRTLDLKLRDWLFDRQPTMAGNLLHALAMLLLLPLFIFALIPNIIVYAVPYLITPKLKDKMFKASIYFGLSLVTIPLTYGLTFMADYLITDDIIISIVHTALLPILGLFAWYYKIDAIKLKAKFQYTRHQKLRKIDDIAAQRRCLWSKIDKIVNN